MNFDKNVLDNRFELEGLKHITGLTGYGIANGWYISVNSSKFLNDRKTIACFGVSTGTSYFAA